MSNGFLTTLLENAALLLALVVILDLSVRGQRHKERLGWHVVAGLILGAAGVCLMATAYEWEPGVYFDTRSILLGLSGLFIGPVPTVVATIILVVYRIALGGVFWAGLLVIISSAATGMLWRCMRSGSLHEIRVVELLMFGVVVHMAMLISALSLPHGMGLRVMTSVGPIGIVVYPVATLIFGLLLKDRLERNHTTQALEESEERYRSLFQNNNAVMLLVDAEQRTIVDANDAAQKFYGLQRADLCGRALSTINLSDPRQLSGELDKAISGEQRRFEFVHRVADGGFRDVEVFSGPIVVNGKNLLYAIVHDVTEKRQAERQLRSSERRFRELFSANPHPMWVFDPATLRFLDVNEAAISRYGYSREEFLVMTIADIRPPEDVPGLKNKVVCHDFEKSHTSIWRHLTKSGEVFDVEITARTFTEGSRPARLVLAQDISARLQAERSLRVSEERWQFALENSKEAVWDWDLRTGEMFYSPRWQQMLGFEGNDVPRFNAEAEKLIHPDDLARRQRALEECIRHGRQDYECEFRMRGGDGSYRWIQSRGGVVEREPETGRALRLIGTHADITERRRANERLALLNTAIQAMPSAVVITDREGRIQWVNNGFCRLTGYAMEEVIGKNPRVLKSGRQSSEVYAALWATIMRGEVWQGELINRRKDGTEFHERVIIAPVSHESSDVTHFIAIKQDVSEQKALEQKMLRSQRMEGIGLLAGGIAHDLNNVLAPILLSVELMRMEHLNDSLCHSIDMVEFAAQRGAAMVRQVLTFARGIDGERAPIRPRDLTRELAQMLEETFPRNIVMRREVPLEVPLVVGDATQLQQVLLNLAVNARDAMPQGGQLTIRVEARQLHSAWASPLGAVPPGNYVVFSVIDTGEGIPPDVQDRIFDPFFTTKPRGKGTGLGLPTALGIVRSHKGFIDYVSAPGKGTEFHIFLPAVQEHRADSRPPIEIPAVNGTGRTALVCDDEPAIVEALSAILRRSNFEVIQASNGVEAVTLFRRESHRVSLIVIDLMMPVMPGDRAVAEILSMRPDVSVLFMSGLMERDAINRALEGAAGRRVAFAKKPFTAAELMQPINRLLSDEPAENFPLVPPV